MGGLFIEEGRMLIKFDETTGRRNGDSKAQETRIYAGRSDQLRSSIVRGQKVD